MANKIKIKKYSGDIVDFDLEKLKNSLRNSHADDALINEIAASIENKLYPGISTRKIYQIAFQMLKKKTNVCASRYKLKKAIMELGPSGFPFEKFVGAILSQEGFQTQVGVFVQGACVMHEVDVVAITDHTEYMVECKYHNTQGKVSDVKVPLYIHSRFLDINNRFKKETNNSVKFQQGWIYTNTRFSTDAITYGKCVGLNLVSWDYPHHKSLKQKIDTLGLFPITSLTTITRKEKEKILNKGVVLCKELYENPHVLEEVGIEKVKHKKILENVKGLCNKEI